MRTPQILALLLIFLITEVVANPQVPSEPLPEVIQHDNPTFPQIARTAHVSGEVHVKVTTDGKSVTEAVAESGPPLLRRAAVDNTRTWKFVAHTPGTFEVTFDFRFLADKTTFLAEPGVVDIAVLPPDREGDASTRLDYTLPATWDLELKTVADHIKAPLTLWTYGPWLRGYTLGSGDQKRVLGNPRVDGDMLGFDVLLDDSFGQRLAFSLVGKKSGNKIQGIFLDAWGKSGRWTAVPSKAAPPNCAAPTSVAEGNVIPVPEITRHEEPEYPMLPWEANIQGEVRMRVSSDNYCVGKITAQSSEPLLTEAAEANVRSWWFGFHDPGTFNVTFKYRLLRPEISFLEKPGVVGISEITYTLEVPESGLWNHGGFSHEIWKAQLTSPSGDLDVTFQFEYGCCEEGRATDAKGTSGKITQGFRFSQDVGFSTIVAMANGRRARVSFIGIQRSYDRIQGVFLDDSGTSGTWSAHLVSHGALNIYM